MARAGVTSTGINELRKAMRTFPDELRAKFRSVARATALRVQAGARARLLRQTQGTGATAELIAVTEEDRGFVITSRAPSGKPANLVLWLEYGTEPSRKGRAGGNAAARPYMWPAFQAESTQYQADMLAAAESAAEALR